MGLGFWALGPPEVPHSLARFGVNEGGTLGEGG